MKDRMDDDENQLVPRTIIWQLRSLISKEIVPLELRMLSDIEKLVHPSKTPKWTSPLGIWACLWTIILSYKELLIFQRALLKGPVIDLNFFLNKWPTNFPKTRLLKKIFYSDMNSLGTSSTL